MNPRPSKCERVVPSTYNTSHILNLKQNVKSQRESLLKDHILVASLRDILTDTLAGAYTQVQS